MSDLLDLALVEVAEEWDSLENLDGCACSGGDRA